METTAKVVTVISEKGGAGKTTLSMNVAGTLGKRGFKILVVDMDPQGTATGWGEAASEDAPFPAAVISLARMKNNFSSEVKKHVGNYDVILIDCPPGVESPIGGISLMIADLALIPIRPSPPDVNASLATKKLVSEAILRNQELKHRVVIVDYDERPKMTRFLVSSIREDQSFTVLNAYAKARVAYQEAVLIGGTVHNVGDAEAVKEMDGIVDEICEILSLPQSICSAANAD